MKAPDTGDIVRSIRGGRYYVVEKRCGKHGRAFLLDLRSLSTGLPQALTTSEVERYRGPRWLGEDAFDAYFQAADEIDGGLSLDDLDAGLVWEAKVYADETSAPFPPELAFAEEIALDRANAARLRRLRAAEEVRVGGES